MLCECFDDGCDRLNRAVAELDPGDAYDSVPGGDQLLVSSSVAFECGCCGVVGVAVYLDDQALLWPQCIDDVAEHRLIEERTLEVGLLDQVA